MLVTKLTNVQIIPMLVKSKLFKPVICSTGKHSLKFYLTASSGVSAFPEFVAVAMVDEVALAYCSNIKRTELKQDWMRKLTGDDPHRWDRNKQNCMNYQRIFNLCLCLRCLCCSGDGRL